jgi:hypothetical protein
VFCGRNFCRVGNTDACYNWGSFAERWRKILINKQEPVVGQGPAITFFRQNNICMRAVDYSQYGATTLAPESLRAQLHSQCISSLRPGTKIKKFDMKTNF